MARKTGRVRNLVILLGSGGLHGLVLLLLLAGLRPPPAPLPEPPVDLQILSLPRQTPRPPPETLAEAAPSAAAPARALDIRPRIPMPQGPPPKDGPSAILLPSNPGSDGSVYPSAGVSAGLRGQLGCDNAELMKLTKAERVRCDIRLAEGGKDARMLLVLSPEKKAAFDGDCKKDDQWCLYRTGQGPYPGLFALGKKKK